jgi:hypothetical protein
MRKATKLSNDKSLFKHRPRDHIPYAVLMQRPDVFNLSLRFSDNPSIAQFANLEYHFPVELELQILIGDPLPVNTHAPLADKPPRLTITGGHSASRQQFDDPDGKFLDRNLEKWNLIG